MRVLWSAAWTMDELSALLAAESVAGGGEDGHVGRGEERRVGQRPCGPGWRVAGAIRASGDRT